MHFCFLCCFNFQEYLKEKKKKKQEKLKDMIEAKEKEKKG